jgi:hypothetical protein
VIKTLGTFVSPCDTFFQALGHMNAMNAVVERNVKMKRSVRLGKVVEFRGMVSTGVLVK